MVVRAKEMKGTFFKDIKVGQVFRDIDSDNIFMKVNFEDNYFYCPRCGEEIPINDDYAVELKSGLLYGFNSFEEVEIIQGAFVEE